MHPKSKSLLEGFYESLGGEGALGGEEGNKREMVKKIKGCDVMPSIQPTGRAAQQRMGCGAWEML